MSMFEDIPVGIGIIYEGERIRGREMQFELGGPREDHKFELVQALGLDRKGRYDLAVFVGFSYYLEWLVLNGLKSFAQGLTTISLSRSYQPNAGWSLGTMKAEEWKEVIDVIVKSIKEGN